MFVALSLAVQYRSLLEDDRGVDMLNVTESMEKEKRKVVQISSVTNSGHESCRNGYLRLKQVSHRTPNIKTFFHLHLSHFHLNCPIRHHNAVPTPPHTPPRSERIATSHRRTKPAQPLLLLRPSKCPAEPTNRLRHDTHPTPHIRLCSVKS
jgi:hypothetical protein